MNIVKVGGAVVAAFHDRPNRPKATSNLARFHDGFEIVHCVFAPLRGTGPVDSRQVTNAQKIAQKTGRSNETLGLRDALEILPTKKVKGRRGAGNLVGPSGGGDAKETIGERELPVVLIWSDCRGWEAEARGSRRHLKANGAPNPAYVATQNSPTRTDMT